MENVKEGISVSVVYALPEHTHLIKLNVKPGTTIQQAIAESGLLQRCPEIDLDKNRVGIFSKLKDLDTVLHDGDRIEIYRDLLIDPKEARRIRASKKNRSTDQD